jgi:hypothetical protein
MNDESIYKFRVYYRFINRHNVGQLVAFCDKGHYPIHVV